MSYFRQVLRLLGAESRALTLIGSVGVLEAVVSLVSPWVAARALDTALPEAARSTLGLLALGTVVAAAHTAWAGWLHERISVVLQHRLEARCLDDLVRRYLATPFQKLSETDFGGTGQTFAAASQIVLTTLGSLIELVTQCLSGIVTLIMLCSYSAGLGAATVLLALVFALVSAAYSVREAGCVEKVLAWSSRADQRLHVLLRALPTLRASGATQRQLEQWAGLVRGQACAAVERENVRLNRMVLIQGGQHAATWVATAWLAQSTLRGELSIGSLMTCTILTGSLLRVAIGLTQTMASFAALRPHFGRVNALLGASLAQPLQQDYRALALVAASQGDRLSLDGVWFRYGSGQRWVLENHTQSFPAHALTVLRAPSGAGKSTMLRLLAGLVPPERGRVEVLGCDPYTTHGLVAYLPQQCTLLEASIATNLTTLSGAPIERALRVAEATGLSDMLACLPMGSETLISSGGSNLSSGQRQLVLLTALFASDCPVVLLDEATSQLDAGAKARIDWSELTRARTVISVQHV